MTERLHNLPEEELARAMRSLASEVAYPPTPDLARTVRARLLRPAQGRRWAPTPMRRLAMAAVVLVAVAGGVLALPATRTAASNWLRLHGITIFVAPSLPPVPTPSSPTSADTGVRLGLGERVTLAKAEARFGYHVFLPDLPGLGPPDAIYLQEPAGGGEVSLLWAPSSGLTRTSQTGVGLLIMELPGSADPSIAFAKTIGPGTQVEPVNVGATQGVWVSGKPSVFFYSLPGGGETNFETLRLAGNTLLWDEDGLTLRIESSLSRDQALAIARSMH
jgi:hypothetical protein